VPRGYCNSCEHALGGHYKRYGAYYNTLFCGKQIRIQRLLGSDLEECKCERKTYNMYITITGVEL